MYQTLIRAALYFDHLNGHRYCHSPGQNYSGGMQMRCALAQHLSHRARTKTGLEMDHLDLHRQHVWRLSTSAWQHMKVMPCTAIAGCIHVGPQQGTQVSS